MGYVRMNRRRLKGEDGNEDCALALDTLFTVVLTMARIMAPFTPFLTETMYQQLRKKVPKLAGPDFASVHYLPLPTAKENLIDEGIERAVSRMQAVVDLGRILRDRKTMPIKYPLPEVVIIHKDQQCLDDLSSLERFIKEELNVRLVTLSSDKASYGVMLRAEPDHKTLGFRLKGAFKPVMAEIKTLSDEALTKFIEGSPLAIQGHDIQKEDLRIMYSFSGEKSAELSEKYEADSSGDILVMLDVTPDKEMLEEGVAREVVNRVQKLRKSAGLKVSDRVTMYYTIQPADHNLCGILTKHLETIQTSSRTPLRPTKTGLSKPVKMENYDLTGAKLTLQVIPGFPSDYISSNSDQDVGCVPTCPWVNLVLANSHPAKYVKSNKGGLLLPKTVSFSLDDLINYVKDVFGIYTAKVELFKDAEKSVPLVDVSNLAGETIYIFTQSDSPANVGLVEGFNVKFINVTMKNGETTSLLLENPVGSALDITVGLSCVNKGEVRDLFEDETRKKKVVLNNVSKHVGKTLYL